ncbi:LPXTG cell wall anchor domain-containing protein [Bacteroidota bacterium]
MKKNSVIRNYFIVSLFVIVITNSVNYGQVRLKAEVDSSNILIGDQVKIRFKVVQPKDMFIGFPSFIDSIVDNVEILEDFDRDTTFLTNNEIEVVKEYLVTCFDSGFYYFPPYEFRVKNEFVDDTIQSNPFYLQVATIEIADTSKAIADIKKPFEAPLSFQEIFPYIVYSLLGILIVGTLIYVLYKRKKNQPILIRKIPKEPPHITALNELEKIKAEKLWQQGKVKEYYTRITDVVRIYIEKSFQVKAMEETTSEILYEFKENKLIDNESIELLTELLVLADFVKFAKAKPLPEENDKSFHYAYNFVRLTKWIHQKEEDRVSMIERQDEKEEMYNLEAKTEEEKPG